MSIQNKVTNYELSQALDNAGEEWRDVVGYEGKYKVSNSGRVVSLLRKQPKEMKQFLNTFGCLQVMLSYNGKTKSIRIHRLVADAFIPNIDNKPQINHINEIKTDNTVSNLEWVTNKENQNHGTTNRRKSKALTKTIVQICPKTNMVLKVWEYVYELAESGYNRKNIQLCCLGYKKIHRGYRWRYLEDVAPILKLIEEKLVEL